MCAICDETPVPAGHGAQLPSLSIRLIPFLLVFGRGVNEGWAGPHMRFASLIFDDRMDVWKIIIIYGSPGAP